MRWLIGGQLSIVARKSIVDGKADDDGRGGEKRQFLQRKEPYEVAEGGKEGLIGGYE